MCEVYRRTDWDSSTHASAADSTVDVQRFRHDWLCVCTLADDLQRAELTTPSKNRICERRRAFYIIQGKGGESPVRHCRVLCCTSGVSCRADRRGVSWRDEASEVMWGDRRSTARNIHVSLSLSTTDDTTNVKNWQTRQRPLDPGRSSTRRHKPGGDSQTSSLKSWFSFSIRIVTAYPQKKTGWFLLQRHTV